MEEEQPEINRGFDRGLEYNQIKEQLIKKMNRLYSNLKEDKLVPFNRRIIGNQIWYILIAMIQLKNGSRISEACKAFQIWMQKPDLSQKVLVKISKSGGIKYNLQTKKKYVAKPRYRKMIFPLWFPMNIFRRLYKTHNWNALIQCKRLQKRVLDFLLTHLKCNTHSLRYACINYLLTEKKIPMPTVAKFVGHVNVQQLVTYTQEAQVDEIFDLD